MSQLDIFLPPSYEVYLGIAVDLGRALTFWEL